MTYDFGDMYRQQNPFNDKHTNRKKGTFGEKSPSLEDYINGYAVPKSKPMSQQFTKAHYFRSSIIKIVKLAKAEDNFNVIMGKINEAIDNTVSKYSVEQGIKEVLVEYTNTQKQLAKIFAEVGDMEEVEKHARNMNQGVNLGGGVISMADPIATHEILEKAAKNADPKYFLNKIRELGEKNDFKEMGRIINLALINFEQLELITPPKKNQKADENYIKVTKAFNKIANETYVNAFKKEIITIIGNAVNSEKTFNQMFVDENKKRIEEYTEILALKIIQINSVEGVAFQKYANNMFENFYEACEEAFKNPTHPLNSIFEAKANALDEVTEFKLKEVDTKALTVVPANSPIFVHKFYQPIFNKYHN